MIDVLFAQDQPPPPGGNMMFLMVAIMGLFYVVVLLPMSRRQKKDQQALLASVARGARVVTSAGIVGTVVSAKDGEDEIVIRSEDTRLRVKRNTVTQVVGTDAGEAGK